MIELEDYFMKKLFLNALKYLFYNEETENSFKSVRVGFIDSQAPWKFIRDNNALSIERLNHTIPVSAVDERVIGHWLVELDNAVSINGFDLKFCADKKFFELGLRDGLGWAYCSTSKPKLSLE